MPASALSRWGARLPPASLPALGMGLGLAWWALVPLPALAWLGLVAFALLAWRHLALAVTLLPLTFPYWFVPRPLVAGKVFPASEMALAICLAVAALHAARRLHGTQRAPARLAAALRGLLARAGSATTLGAVLLAVGVGLGVLVARRPPEAARAFRWEIAEPLLYLLLVLATVRGRDAVRRLYWALLASALLVAALATAQMLLLHVSFAPLAQGNRLGPLPAGAHATGIIYGSGNSLGAWLERALPAALALAVVPAAAMHRRARLLAAGVTLALLPALLWSGSRGALVGTVAGCALVVVICPWPWRRLALPLTGALALAGALLLALWLRGGLAALLGSHGGTLALRPLLWLAALAMLRDHPLVGIGPDQFLYYYSDRYTIHPYWITQLAGRPTYVWYQPDLAHPHNLVLELLLSGGLLALVGFALVLAALVRTAVALRPGAVADWRAPLAVGALASVGAGLVHGLVDSAYFQPDLALALWWAVGLLVLLSRHRPRVPPPAWFRRAAPRRWRRLVWPPATARRDTASSHPTPP